MVHLLDSIATRQEHLTDLMEYFTSQIAIWGREYKMHHTPDDRAKLTNFEVASKLLKGYVDSFTADIVTDVEEPVIIRVAKLSDVGSRYDHLVSLMELWRDAAEVIKEKHVKEPRSYVQPEGITEPYLELKIVPTKDKKKIFEFEKSAWLVEDYQESLQGQKISSFRDGHGRILRTVLNEAYQIGVAANKKRILDAADEKIKGETKNQERPALGTESSKTESPTKNYWHGMEGFKDQDGDGDIISDTGPIT